MYFLTLEHTLRIFRTLCFMLWHIFYVITYLDLFFDVMTALSQTYFIYFIRFYAPLIVVILVITKCSYSLPDCKRDIDEKNIRIRDLTLQVKSYEKEVKRLAALKDKREAIYDANNLLKTRKPPAQKKSN